MNTTDFLAADLLNILASAANHSGTVETDFLTADPLDILASVANHSGTIESEAIEKQKLTAMLFAQIALENRMHPEWYDQGWSWSMAITHEVTELMAGKWEFWKQIPKASAEQQLLEVIDIWTFSLASMTEHIARTSDGPDSLHVRNTVDTIHKYFYDSVEYLNEVHATTDLLADINSGAVNIPAFAFIAREHGVSDFHDLFALYGCKLVLNQFRQDHGYSDGTYKKIWFGEEDNITLMKIVNEPVTKSLSEIYSRLEVAYKASLA